jgi:hypothetical protein
VVSFTRYEDSEELDGPAVSALRREIAEVDLVSHWIGDQNLSSRAPPYFERHFKQLVPAAFAVVGTHQLALGPHGGLWPVFLMCNLLG